MSTISANRDAIEEGGAYLLTDLFNYEISSLSLGDSVIFQLDLDYEFFGEVDIDYELPQAEYFSDFGEYSYYNGYVVFDDILGDDVIFNVWIASTVPVGEGGVSQVNNYFTITFHVDEDGIPLPHLFTPLDEVVNFNMLEDYQRARIAFYGDYYDAGAGNDRVTLPGAAAAADLNPGGIARPFDRAHPFYAGMGNDTIAGSAFSDLVRGDEGNDSIIGYAGTDELFGGDGADTLNGGAGADALDGGAGDDVLLISGADATSDSIEGGTGNDRLQVVSGSGTLTLTTLQNFTGIEVFDGSGQAVSGTSTADLLNFSTFSSVVNLGVVRTWGGDDTIVGTAGADTIDAGLGNDSIVAGDGNDLVWIATTESPSDTIKGGAGYDTLKVREGSGPLTLQSTQYIGTFEVFDASGQTISGTTGNDLLNFSFFSTVLNMAAISLWGGHDKILGSSISDTIDGGLGYDSILASGGDDLVLIAGVEAQNDTLDGGSGFDTLQIRAGTGALTMKSLQNISGFEVFDASGQGISGTTVDDFLDFSIFSTVTNLASITTWTGNDTVIGNSGNDTIDGRGGNDSLLGGGGDDWFLISKNDALGDTIDGGGGSSDTLQVRVGTGALTLATTAHFTGIEVFNGAGQEVWGTAGGDLLDFSSFTSVNSVAGIVAWNGNDTIVGSAGADTIDGRADNDSIMGGNGNDWLTGGSGADQFVFTDADQGTDRITDFAVALDQIVISAGGFVGGLFAGVELAALGRFVANTTGTATDAVGQFILETDIGRLWWDVDGTGAADRVAVADLQGTAGQTLSASDLVIIA